MIFKTRVFLIKLIILFAIIGPSSCRSYRDGIPPANLPDTIRDSWYYCRDTINFYQVGLDASIVSTIDTLIHNEPLSANNYWFIEIREGSNEVKRFCLDTIYIEKLAYINSLDEEVIFKAFRYKGKTVLVSDDNNVLGVDRSKPLIRLYNPGQLGGIWVSRSRPICFKSEDGLWEKYNQF